MTLRSKLIQKLAEEGRDPFDPLFFFDEKYIKAVRLILGRLDRYKPYLFTTVEGHTVYIHFDALPKKLPHVIRISDRDEPVPQIRYRWNLRFDGANNVKDKRDWEHYHSDPAELINDFKRYYETNEVQQWP